MTPIQRVRLIVPAAAVVAVVLWLTVGRGGSTDGELMASGTVEAVEADLGFQIPGRIDGITVREGDAVSDGSELAHLDRSDLTAQRTAATAQLAVSRAGLTELQTGTRDEEIGQARAAERAARRRLTDARRELDRSRRLFEGGAISQQMLDNRQTALEIAEADHEQATERLRMLETGPRRERIDAQSATVRLAEATIAQIDATIDNTKIVAPFDGIVTVRHREPGEIVGAGTPVLTVMNPAERWVRIYLRQDVVGRVSLGGTVTITADSYPEREYRGRVTYISSEAEFTPRNVQTTEERVKLVFEVWVNITEDPSFDLKPGLAADVRIHDRNPR
jgi:HlyD family secretion protein